MRSQRELSLRMMLAAFVFCGILTFLCPLGPPSTGAEGGATYRLLADSAYEMSESGWMAMGSDAKVRFVPDAAHIKTGKPGLALDYNIAPRQMAAAVLPIIEGSFATMKSLRFWLKTDSATAVAVVLSEKKPDGGNYDAVIWSPKDTWQYIELTPADFALIDGPNDPRDADGKLDLDQVEGVGILDLSPLFTALSEIPNLPMVVDKRSGAHTLYVDDFQTSAEAPSAPPAAGAATTVVDDFHRNYLSWFTPGGAALSLSQAQNPLAGHALEASYEQAPGRLVLIAHSLAQMDLSKSDRLAFDIASDKSAQIVLTLEKKKAGGGQGPRYTVTVDVPGNRQPTHKTAAFADFKLDENGPADPEGHLDLGRLKTLSLIDIMGAFSQENQKNTIWVANIRALGGAGGRGGATVEHAHDMSRDMPEAMSHNENGHVTESMASHHMHMGPHMKLTELRPPSPEDAKRAQAIVHTLFEAIQKYTDYRVAIKDGYLPYLPSLPQPQYHFTNNGYGYLEAFRFDPAHPTSLLYKKTSDGYQLLGAMYTAPYAASEDTLNARVPLSVARWHLHTNVCLPEGGMAKISDWTRFGPGGSISTEQACTEAGGKFTPHLFGWMVHVYPFEQNPDQMWAH